MFNFNWRKRAIEAEKQLAEAQKLLTFYNDALEGLQRRFVERSALISIHKDGRRIVFTFVRNNEIHRIGAVGTWDDDIDGWKKLLIDPLPHDKATEQMKE